RCRTAKQMPDGGVVPPPDIRREGHRPSRPLLTHARITPRIRLQTWGTLRKYRSVSEFAAAVARLERSCLFVRSRRPLRSGELGLRELGGRRISLRFEPRADAAGALTCGFRSCPRRILTSRSPLSHGLLIHDLDRERSCSWSLAEAPHRAASSSVIRRS